jgi:hypothetical protein
VAVPAGRAAGWLKDEAGKAHDIPINPLLPVLAVTRPRHCCRHQIKVVLTRHQYPESLSKLEMALTTIYLEWVTLVNIDNTINTTRS